ncbi:MAG: thioredoxin-like domain-containing protein [Bacteroidota bacterium]
MKRILLIFSLVWMNAQLKAQVDTSAVLQDIQTKADKITVVSVKVKLNHKAFYNSDTSITEGSVVADYSYAKNASFALISIHEKEYSRYLVYDTSAIEYSYYTQTKIVNEIKKVDPEKIDVGGLLEPLFPMILDKSQKFHEWFFADYSRIQIRDLNDTTVTLAFNGPDSTYLLESPKIQIELYRKNGFPKEIITKFTLANKEVQYDHYIFNYNLSNDELEQHWIAYRNIKKYTAQPFSNDTGTKEVRAFFNNGEAFTSLQLLSLQQIDVLLTASEKKFVLLDFSYIACKPCNEAIPTLNRLANDFKTQLDIVSINPFDKREQILKHNQRMNVLYKTYVIQPQSFNKLSIKSFPYFVLIGKNGVIKLVTTGYGENLYERIAEIIKETQ